MTTTVNNTGAPTQPTEETLDLNGQFAQKNGIGRNPIDGSLPSDTINNALSPEEAQIATATSLPRYGLGSAKSTDENGNPNNAEARAARRNAEREARGGNLKPLVLEPLVAGRPEVKGPYGSEELNRDLPTSNTGKITADSESKAQDQEAEANQKPKRNIWEGKRYSPDDFEGE